MPYGIDSELLGSPFVFPMKLEAVIISAGCSDFLAHTLPMNKPLFDKILVVTSPEDRDTQRICDYWNVPYERTDVLSTRWEGVFCKGKGINVGLDKLDKDGWVAHMDADIALPPHSRKAPCLARREQVRLKLRHQLRIFAVSGNDDPKLARQRQRPVHFVIVHAEKILVSEKDLERTHAVAHNLPKLRFGLVRVLRNGHVKGVVAGTVAFGLRLPQVIARERVVQARGATHRSEERRVGKEGRLRRAPYLLK